MTDRLTDSHQPVLLEETVNLVCGREWAPSVDAQGGHYQGAVREGVYVDATFGRGGHTRRLLQALGAGSRVIAFDRDPQAVAAGRALAAEDARVTMAHGNFAALDQLLDQLGIDKVQGVMMDLGTSSPQLDDPQRGFSFRFDAPLDMRMDTSRGPTAAEWLNAAAEADIARVLREYGEERYARRIAAAIVAARPITTTTHLVEVVRGAQPRATPGKHDATRVFQAVRIEVNQELAALESGLVAAFERLLPGGRLAAISFHSLEDRLVKRFVRSMSTPPPMPRRLPVRGGGAQARGRLVGRPVTPGDAELRGNPRARSARLRVVEKLG
ncbi:MAG: 16S rRNA (cytosine(1402)-N(4))-methyltransferase RsmH [Pseudomonadales bacterium]